MTLNELNQLSTAEIAFHLQQCCNASQWYNNLAAMFPFTSVDSLQKAADTIWETCEEADWLEAFEAHPKIGDVDSLAKKFAGTKTWAGNEQEKVDDADHAIIQALADGNEAYFQKFGFIFIVFATGKSAEQMLNLLQERLPNDRKMELRLAAAEQHKITKLRINKLLQ